MSVSKWAYTPEVCDGGGCPGDCDLCDKPKVMEDEDDMTDYIKRDAVIDYLASNNMPWRDWVKDIPSADVVEVDKVNKIYEKLADLFCIPCNYSPCDEIMLESGRCREDCGNISVAECWKRYFEVVCDGERAEA